jgi:hypothetical protein
MKFTNVFDLFVPNQRQSDAQKIADEVCTEARDASMTWESRWTVRAIMNGDIAGQCDIAKQKADPTIAAAKKTRDAQLPQRGQSDQSFDALLKSLSRHDPARSDDSLVSRLAMSDERQCHGQYEQRVIARIV